MKYAMTLDGKIATRTGASRWITGEAARRRVHQDRHRYSAIMAGVGTVLADDPLLTCRMEGGKNPLRVICDTRLRTPLDSQIVRTAREVSHRSGHLPVPSEKRRAPYEAAGCRVWTLPERDGHVDLPALMERLGAEEIDSVLLEGGGTLNWAALEQRRGPKGAGVYRPQALRRRGRQVPGGRAWVWRTPPQAVRLQNSAITRLGEDFLLEGEVVSDVYGNR